MFALRHCLKLEGHHDYGVRRETQVRQLLAFQVQRNGFANVFSQLVERLRLSDDRQVRALSDVLPFAPKHADLNGSLHVSTLSP